MYVKLLKANEGISRQRLRHETNSVHLHKNKGGKFLKKLWCYVGGRVKQGNLVLSTELITLIGHRSLDSYKADDSSVCPSSECSHSL